MSNDVSPAIDPMHDERHYGSDESAQVSNGQSSDAPINEFNDNIIVCRISIPPSLINRINDETAVR